MPNSRRTATALVVVTLAALLVHSNARAREDLITYQLNRRAEQLGLYRVTHDEYRGWLDADESETVTYRLQAGVSYALIGACDEDCFDLDFELLDPSGRPVVHDFAADDLPEVWVVPPYTQTYRLRVIMYNCTIEPCNYGIAAYRD